MNIYCSDLDKVTEQQDLISIMNVVEKDDFQLDDTKKAYYMNKILKRALENLEEKGFKNENRYDLIQIFGQACKILDCEEHAELFKEFDEELAIMADNLSVKEFTNICTYIAHQN